MNNKLDIAALLRRGGLMSPAEVEQLTRELTEAKLSEMAAGISTRSGDQPVKVVPFSDQPPKIAQGYFTQQKYVWLKTPEEMERILGVYGKFRNGALVLQFRSPLRSENYENKAYTYLPGGEEYKPKPDEKTFLPAKAPAPQWRLKYSVPADCIAKLGPGRRFEKAQH
jgi:hypothetical protein